jgi:hypothetical protein
MGNYLIYGLIFTMLGRHINMKKQQFETGYSIYQNSDGSFNVYKLDEKGNKILVDDHLEFYANAVCVLIADLMKEGNHE